MDLYDFATAPKRRWVVFPGWTSWITNDSNGDTYKPIRKPSSRQSSNIQIQDDIKYDA